MQGLRPDEALEVSLKLPFAPGSEAGARATAGDAAQQPAPAPAAATGTGGALLGGKRKGGLPGLGTLLPVPRFGNGVSAQQLTLLPPPAVPEAAGAPSDGDGGHFMLRCGNLLMSAEVGPHRVVGRPWCSPALVSYIASAGCFSQKRAIAQCMGD